MMTPFEQRFIDQLRTLSLDKQQEVLDFVQFLQQKMAQSAASESLSSESEQPISVMEASQEYISYVAEPEELSTQKQS